MWHHGMRLICRYLGHLVDSPVRGHKKVSSPLLSPHHGKWAHPTQRLSIRERCQRTTYPKVGGYTGDSAVGRRGATPCRFPPRNPSPPEPCSTLLKQLEDTIGGVCKCGCDGTHHQTIIVYSSTQERASR